jgi:hypothetical protein
MNSAFADQRGMIDIAALTENRTFAQIVYNSMTPATIAAD